MIELKCLMIITGSLDIGGVQRAVSNLTDYLCHNNIEVIIGLVADNPTVEISINTKANIYTIPTKIYKNSFDRYFSRIKFTRSLIKKYRPQAIVSFLSYVNITSCIAALGMNVPLIVSERSDPSRDPDRNFFRILRQLVYPIADGYIFQTLEASRFFSKRIQQKGIIISNALPCVLPKVNREEIIKKVVAVGRLAPVKNYEMLLKSFEIFHKIHKDYILEIYGDGPCRDDLSTIVQSCNLENYVKFCGNVKDVLTCILDANMFVLTSNYEGLPNALLEAMAMEVPCISTDCPIGGPRSLIIDNYNGFLVAVNDVASLSQKMCYLAEHPSEAAKIGHNAGKVRVSNSSAMIGSKYCEYVIRILDRRIGKK